MSAYDQIHKAYVESQKNNFFDAWGVVVNPITAYALRTEVLSRMSTYYAQDGVLETIFGLVLIPCEVCETDKAYIVDEELGRTILGERKVDEKNDDDGAYCTDDTDHVGLCHEAIKRNN